MTVNRTYAWIAAALAGILLGFGLWNRGFPVQDSETTVLDEPAGRTGGASIESPLRKQYLEDCESCPDSVLGHDHKRSAPSNTFTDCREFLAEAAASGNPNPDTSHLKDCSGSPLHYAETPQEVLALVESGADPNVQDLQGRTPLYLQVQKAMMMPSESGQSIVSILLESGSDPWMKTHSGQTPFDIARLSNVRGVSVMRAESRFRRQLEEEGTTLEAELARNPALREGLERFRREPQIATEILAALADAMRQTQPATQ